MPTPREYLRRYSEIYTVFLPLCAVFGIVYAVLSSLNGSSPVTAPIGPDDVIGLHRQLIEIPSVTGNEYGVAQFLQTYLTARGYTVELQPVSEEPPRANVFAYQGNERSTRVLLTSHIDTVPPYIPHSVHDGYIWGRGSVDAKASVAAQITALQEMTAAKNVSVGDVALLFVVGEETDGIGMTTASAKLGLTWETVIFGEPTEGKLAVGHKGLLLADMYATGKASHSGYPELGIDANYFLVEAAYGLGKLALPASPLLGNTTLNVGTLDGGVAANVVSAKASAGIAVRVAADMPAVVEKMQAVVDAVDNVELDITLTYDPVILDYDVPGFDTIACSYGTDVPHLAGKHKKYLYGPGSILYAHADNERLSEDDLYDSVAGYLRLLAHALA
ncbi:uncharacterized protein V1510DRAFT_410427 [Dipodascopsis tothii]|uniref:uncharacterized protein n=1 Tax=Dipodascopsis tothii TaxID=44089 RepID=UPI0034CEFB76